jgi:hypothetical protein
MESQFNCAGICEIPELFMFSNVNNAEGPPQLLCKDVAISFIKKEGSRYYKFMLAAGFVSMIGVICSFVVTYYKNHKRQFSWEKYQQMKF